MENNILYTAVIEDERTSHFSPDLLKDLPEFLEDISPQAKNHKDIVHLYDCRSRNMMMVHDMMNKHIICYFKEGDERRDTHE